MTCTHGIRLKNPCALCDALDWTERMLTRALDKPDSDLRKEITRVRDLSTMRKTQRDNDPTECF
ncbi:hypothetical protein ROJ8625_04124 [Roseivivax jejudonensis]|uniref:Uncharacterized protein n=1 Tax=Roseivivax jejudonensis TaxID=1529041 RepID=A0A1X7AB23_9RHOB|nr:hypothetical protein [Roseivivax jejudonensis]SLN74905.1 hypothetical protein ROJ8625_04124 [Roseivivax jejudonensis]